MPDIDPPDPVLTPRTRTVGVLLSICGATLVAILSLWVLDRCHARGAGWVVILEILVATIAALFALGYLGSILAGGNEAGRGFKGIADDVVDIEKAAVEGAKSLSGAGEAKP